MPLVDVTLTAGRTPEQVRALLHALHDAVHQTTGARSEHIRVIVREVPRTHWATGDTTVAEMDPTATAPAADHRPEEETP